MAIITISRGSMSGGKALGECVASALGCSCIAREVLVEAAAKLGVAEEFLQERIERSPGFWDRLTSERKTYALAVQAALANYACSADLVYHGLAGHLLLRDVPNVLRVRLIAPLEARVRALMEQRGMTREDAESFVGEVDRHRARWTRLMYDVNIEDPRLYDLVLNMEKTSVASACAVVVTMARQREFVIDDAARIRLCDFALACRVRVALAVHPASRGLALQVAASNGVVTLAGEIPRPDMLMHSSDRWIGELRGVVEQVAGVKTVVLDVHLVNSYG